MAQRQGRAMREPLQDMYSALERTSPQGLDAEVVDTFITLAETTRQSSTATPQTTPQRTRHDESRCVGTVRRTRGAAAGRPRTPEPGAGQVQVRGRASTRCTKRSAPAPCRPSSPSRRRRSSAARSRAQSTRRRRRHRSCGRPCVQLGLHRRLRQLTRWPPTFAIKPESLSLAHAVALASTASWPRARRATASASYGARLHG